MRLVGFFPQSCQRIITSTLSATQHWCNIEVHWLQTAISLFKAPVARVELKPHSSDRRGPHERRLWSQSLAPGRGQGFCVGGGGGARHYRVEREELMITGNIYWYQPQNIVVLNRGAGTYWSRSTAGEIWRAAAAASMRWWDSRQPLEPQGPVHPNMRVIWP